MADLQLRDYQLDLLERIRASFRSGKRRTLAVSPTGSGKTVIFSHVAASSYDKGMSICVLVHRVELLRQTYQKMTRPAGIIAQGSSKTPHRIQIAMVQTLVRRLDHWRDRFDLIIVDEAHHATAATYLKVIEACLKKTGFVLGVTATPVRQNGKGLGDLFEDLVEGPSTKWLVNNGYLTNPRIFIPDRIPDLSAARVRTTGDYDQNDLSEIMTKGEVVGDAVEHYGRICPRRPAVVFTPKVADAYEYAEAFRRGGYQAVAIEGKTDDADRAKAIADLAAGRLHVLASCDLISEGVDVPVIECGILARPTKSMGLCIQQIGRCLRTAPGKTEAYILDHSGNVLAHGHPLSNFKWSLEQKPVPMRTCPHCLAAFEITAEFKRHRLCPECGEAIDPDPKEPAGPKEPKRVVRIDGKLREMTLSEYEKWSEQRRRWRSHKEEEAKAQSYEDFVAIAQRRGYHPGWAGHRWAARQAARTADE